MSIRDWPASERPREKLLAEGAARLSNPELLAIFLRTGVRGKSALDLAQDLIAAHGGLRPLLAAGEEEFTSTPGLGQAKYVQLQAALELARRHLLAQLEDRDSITSPAATRAFLTARLRDLPHEVFGCLYLDTRHRVLGFEELFRGTIDGASVHPREVVKAALAKNAAAVIFAHNHPSGVAEPSDADRRLTRRLADALALVDVRVLDHFVIGEGDPVSFAERGLL
ncbi:MAG TPA: DNA repair protein RadC [Gammaproteobacteria bacterium]|nr:DNA repair protein RadC [Gammaproteobacteria bacterium]